MECTGRFIAAAAEEPVAVVGPAPASSSERAGLLERRENTSTSTGETFLPSTTSTTTVRAVMVMMGLAGAATLGLVGAAAVAASPPGSFLHRGIGFASPGPVALGEELSVSVVPKVGADAESQLMSMVRGYQHDEALPELQPRAGGSSSAGWSVGSIPSRVVTGVATTQRAAPVAATPAASTLGRAPRGETGGGGQEKEGGKSSSAPSEIIASLPDDHGEPGEKDEGLLERGGSMRRVEEEEEHEQEQRGQQQQLTEDAPRSGSQEPTEAGILSSVTDDSALDDFHGGVPDREKRQLSVGGGGGVVGGVVGDKLVIATASTPAHTLPKSAAAGALIEGEGGGGGGDGDGAVMLSAGHRKAAFLGVPKGSIKTHPDRAAKFMRSVKTHEGENEIPGRVADALRDVHVKIKHALGGGGEEATAVAVAVESESKGEEEKAKVGSLGKYQRRSSSSSSVIAPDGSIVDPKAALAEMMKHAWTAPTYIITLGRPDETKHIGPALRELTKTQGSAAVKRNVHATPGVDITKWPEKLEVAEYAVSGILEQVGKPGDLEGLHGIPWLDALLQRDSKSGKMVKPDILALSHHFGCLFAHLAQWQLAADMGNKDTFVFEADGFTDALLGVPLSSLGDVQHHAPDDYDIVFLHMPGMVAGPKVSEFKTALGETVELYEMNEPDGPAGLSAYMFSERFWRKMRPFIAKQGADMVDAWLMGHLCRPLRKGDWAYMLPKLIKDGESFLNCYKAMTKGGKKNNIKALME